MGDNIMTTASVKRTWWPIIVYLLSIVVNFHCMNAVFNAIYAEKIPSDIDLWAAAATSMYIFAVGFAAKVREITPVAVKDTLFLFGMIMLTGAITAFYVMLRVGTSAFTGVVALAILYAAITRFVYPILGKL